MSAAVLDIVTKRRLDVGERPARRHAPTLTSFMRKARELEELRPKAAIVMEGLVNDLIEETRRG